METTKADRSVVFRLPFPPSTNHYWKSRIVKPKRGKPFISTYISPNGQQFQRDVKAALRVKFGARLRPIHDRLEVVVRLCPPDRIRRDIDNYGGKAILDSLTEAGVWADDRQVDRLVIERGPVVSGGYADVTIRVLPNPQGELFDEPEQEERPW